MNKVANAVLAIILVMTPCLVFGLLSKPVEMGIGVTAGGLVVLLMNLDKFEKIKAGGVEAEMKKEVDRISNELELIKRIQYLENKMPTFTVEDSTLRIETHEQVSNKNEEKQ